MAVCRMAEERALQLCGDIQPGFRTNMGVSRVGGIKGKEKECMQ